MPPKNTQGKSKAKPETPLHFMRELGWLNVEIAEMVGVERTTIFRWNEKNTWPLWALEKLGFTIYLEVEDETK